MSPQRPQPTAPVLTYVECDVPEEQTLAEWRRLTDERDGRRRRRRLGLRLVRRLRR